MTELVALMIAGVLLIAIGAYLIGRATELRREERRRFAKWRQATHSE